MTKAQEQNSTYRLLRFVSKQPIKFARFFAKGLAGLVNLLKISKKSKFFFFARNLFLTLKKMLYICSPKNYSLLS